MNMKIQQLLVLAALTFSVATTQADSLSGGAMDMAKDTATDKMEDAKDNATDGATEKVEDTKKGALESVKDKAMEMGGKLMGK